ncbi:MAG: sigma-70 family RNA polymerase sigma factor [Pseudomonadota bacterium]
MSSETELSALLAATAKRDRAAFQAIYAAQSSKLFAITLRICRDRAIAEDALQDAFVEIWRKAEGFDPARGKAGAWMSAIARNRAIDQIRRRGRGPAFGSGGEDDADAMAALPDLSAPRDGGAEMIALAQCLDRLEPRDKEMVLLAYYEGYSREDLSARYEAPVNTIKTWLRRGLIALRGCLETG